MDVDATFKKVVYAMWFSCSFALGQRPVLSLFSAGIGGGFGSRRKICSIDAERRHGLRLFHAEKRRAEARGNDIGEVERKVSIDSENF